jgi:hypothetical protein
MLDSAISYNRSLPLGAIYDDQAVFLHLHQFFDDLVTVSNNYGDWLKDFSLENTNIELQRSNENDKIASSQEFANFVKSQPRRKYLLYAPLSPPYVANPLVYIMNSPTIAHAYEHKRYFRDEFAELINMPEYVNKTLDELNDKTYDELIELYEKFVIQDVESSGSKGTFIIRSKADYDAAVAHLKKESFSGSVVISEFINGQPYSVQVCVTKYGIFAGGLQRQLVDSDYLCNTKLTGAPRWCGGELGGKIPEIIKHRTQEIATVVGSELGSHGYRGIFGIDLLITPTNDVYAIEVNARLTGYTHVLSDMQYAKNKIPFSLLHILELGNYKYEVEDLDALPTMNSVSDLYSYLILHNKNDGPIHLKKEIRNGMYYHDSDTGEIEFVNNLHSIKDIPSNDHFVVLCKFRKSDEITRGKRILKVIKPGKSMGEDGDLDEENQKFIKNVQNYFGIEQ